MIHKKKEIREHGEGSTSWFRIKRNKIYDARK